MQAAATPVQVLESGDDGAWATTNLMWDDGSYAEYGYYIQGQAGNQEMLLKPTDGDKKEL
jgi:hypothetical protein